MMRAKNDSNRNPSMRKLRPQPAPASVLAMAWWMDRSFGELPARVHPVVGIGRLTRLGTRRLRSRSGIGATLLGAAASLGVLSATTCTATVLDRCLSPLSPAFEVPLRALVLTPSFASRSLLDAADRVAEPLERGDLHAARQGLSWLCSRDAQHLNAEELANATIASLAENVCDSVVAPLMAWNIFGAGGAWAVRTANTLDAMIGYENTVWKDAGKFAAKFDDVINYFPARCTGAFIVIAATLHGYNGARAWKVMWRDHPLTPSPNGGWPMAAMAGSLNISINKSGVYELMPEGSSATVQDIRAAQRIAQTAMELSVACSLLIQVFQRRSAYAKKERI